MFALPAAASTSSFQHRPSWAYNKEEKESVKDELTVTKKTSSVVLEASSNAQSEANRRRGLDETYTMPITTSSVKALTQVTNFMSDFNKFAETYEATFQNHLQEYKNDLQKIYNQLVPQEVTHKTFIQRYFFRCGDLQRIQDELDQQQKEIQRQLEQEKTESAENKEIVSMNTVVAAAVKETPQDLPEQKGDDNKNSLVQFRGVSKDSVLQRAAWDVSEGAQITLWATKPPTLVQRQATLDWSSEAAKTSQQTTPDPKETRRSWVCDQKDDTGSRNDQTEGKDDKHSIAKDHTSLYSRLRFSFRRNNQEQQQISVRTALQTKKSNESGPKQNLQLDTAAPRSMSPSRSREESSPAGAKNEISVNESTQGAVALIRSQWEKDEGRPTHKARPMSPDSSLLDDSQPDMRHQQHMSLKTGKTKPENTDDSEGQDKLHMPTEKSGTAPSRSNSARDLIKRMEASNKERRDRTLGPPITHRGRLPRRMSESNSSGTVSAGGPGRASMRTFRSSSFAYRNRGTSPGRNGINDSSNHSLSVKSDQVRYGIPTSSSTIAETNFIGTVRSRSHAVKCTPNYSTAGQEDFTISAPNDGAQLSSPKSRSRFIQGSRSASSAESSIDLNQSFSSFHNDEEFSIPSHVITQKNTYAKKSSLVVDSEDEAAAKTVLLANRRRNLADTYTEPLLPATDKDSNLEDFLGSFQLQHWKDDAALALARYPDTLLIHHERLVLGGLVTEQDFWSRYFYRCDERRILHDLRKTETQKMLLQTSESLCTRQKSLNESQSFPRASHIRKQRATSENLKEKLKNWNNVTRQNKTATTSFSPETRAQRYRKRGGLLTNN
jgi:BSD domain